MVLEERKLRLVLRLLPLLLLLERELEEEGLDGASWSKIKLIPSLRRAV